MPKADLVIEVGIVERLRAFHDHIEGTAGMCDTGLEAADTIEAQAAEIERLRQFVITFAAPYAVQYAANLGLPRDHLLSLHYDVLKECGARMVNFIRHPDHSDIAALDRAGERAE